MRHNTGNRIRAEHRAGVSGGSGNTKVREVYRDGETDSGCW